MAEEGEKIALYDKRRRGNDLKKHLTALGSTLTALAVEWKRLSDTFQGYDRYEFRTDDNGIKVVTRKQFENLRPGQLPSFHEIASISLSTFDPEALKEVLRDLEETKKELAEIREYCRQAGDPLDVGPG